MPVMCRNRLTNILIGVVLCAFRTCDTSLYACVEKWFVRRTNTNVIITNTFLLLKIILLTHSALLAPVQELVVVGVVAWAICGVSDLRMTHTTLLNVIKVAVFGAAYAFFHGFVEVSIGRASLTAHGIQINVVSILARNADTCITIKDGIIWANLTFSGCLIENLPPLTVNADQLFSTVVLSSCLIASSAYSQSMVVFLIFRASSTSFEWGFKKLPFGTRLAGLGCCIKKLVVRTVSTWLISGVIEMVCWTWLANGVSCIQVGEFPTVVAWPHSQVKDSTRLFARCTFVELVIGERFVQWAGGNIVLGC